MKDIICFLKDEDGATAIEYALIASLIFLAIVTAISMVGKSVQTVLYDEIVRKISEVGF